MILTSFYFLNLSVKREPHFMQIIGGICKIVRKVLSDHGFAYMIKTV